MHVNPIIISLYRLVLASGLSLLVYNYSLAQISPDTGYYFSRSFSPAEYQGHSQNWSLLESDDGLIYIGNGNGLLQYDGVEMNMIEVAGGQVALSLARGVNGEIFVGSVNDFGAIVADSIGNSVYRSYLARVPKELRDFEDVWETITTDAGSFFRTRSATFHIDRDDSLHILMPEDRFERIHQVNGEVYIVDLNIGMKQFTGTDFVRIPGGDIFANKSVWFMGSRSDGSVFIATRRGTYIYDGNQFEPFPSEVAPYLDEKLIYEGTAIPGTGFAFATILGGIFVTDDSGTILYRLNDGNGLPNNQSTNVLADRYNNLWVTTTNGFTRFETASPLTFFGRSHGIQAGVEAVARHNGTLFIGTTSGFQYLQESPSYRQKAHFVDIPVTTSDHQNLLSTENGLLATSGFGLVQVQQEQSSVVLDEFEGMALSHSACDPGTVLLGHRGGLTFVHYQDEEWQVKGELEELSVQVTSVHQDAECTYWIGTDFQGIFRVEYHADGNRATDIQQFDTNEHFGTGGAAVYKIDEQILILTGTGIYQPSNPWNPENPFVPGRDEVAGNTEGNTGFSQIHKGTDGRYWVFGGGSNGYITEIAHQPDSVYSGALARIASAVTQDMHVEENGTIWIANPNGLKRFDSNSAYPEGTDFRAFVRTVTQGEQVLFAGNPAAIEPSATLKFANNDLRFRFGVNFFDDAGNIQFQVKLDGFDERWSVWSPEVFRDYTNLPHGSYIMQVRAMNTYGMVSEPGRYAFVILPPWWQTWWAYSLYFLIAGLLLILADRYRNRKLKQREAELEAMVDERTAQLREEKKITEAQAEKLKQLDAEKSRFFANISHEFRTPLTLTIAPLENIKKQHIDGLPEEFGIQIDMAIRNSKRLMRLVDQLLDLAKFEANLFKLKPEPVILNHYLDYVSSRFLGAAERHQIEYIIEIPEQEIVSSIDPEQFEKVVSNLLSNAIKFTPKGGSVFVELKIVQNEAIITVQDNGLGIDEEHLSRLFDRFYQVEKSELQPGSGIGLALVKEITEQHNGRVRVYSKKGKGTTFEVFLPVADIKPENVKNPQLSEDEFYDEMVPEKSTPVPLAEVEPDDGRKSVLIVDDNKDIRSYLRTHFSEEYQVIEAASGNQGISLAKKVLPDIIVSDIMMQDGDGFSLLKELRSDAETDYLPIILLTARAEAEDKLEGLGIGADDYLTKPFSMEELVLRVQNLIERQKRLLRHFERNGGHINHAESGISMHPDPIQADSTDQIYLTKIKDVIQENLHNEDFSVEDLADRLYQSRTHLFRKLKELLNETPSALIKRMRIERAAELLKQNAGTVSEIAYSTGFKSVSQFSRAFRNHYQQTPTEWSRQQH